MLELDQFGNPRNTNTPSLLESLAYQMALADFFGYTWDDSCPHSNQPPQITGETNGIMTIGDSILAMRSYNNCTSNTFKPDIIRTFQNMNKNEEMWYGTPTNKKIKISLSTPALCFLQGASKGSVNCIDSNNDGFFDSNFFYTNTLVFAMDWLVKVTLKGYGPYYNRNKSPSPNYVQEWETEKFKIKVRSGHCAGLDGSKISNCNGNGTSLTIKEVPISEEDRKVDSDEEAFYKNLQWLLYYKKFVLVIPMQVNVSTLGIDAVKDAVYQIIVANGLKGLMNAKPYCSNPNGQCSKHDNGRWLIDGQLLKDYRYQGQITHWSTQPGDAAVLIVGYGCGVQGAGLDLTPSCNWPDNLPKYPDISNDANDPGCRFHSSYCPKKPVFEQIYDDTAYPKKAKEFYGVNPPIIGKTFHPLERLGFLNNQMVLPEQVNNYWEDRNTITPLLVALADVLLEQSDPANNKNALKLLTGGLLPLIKPILDKRMESSLQGGNKTIKQVFIQGNTSIRHPGLPSENDYLPISNLRTPLSFLIESERGAIDGLLPLIAKSDLLPNLINLLYELNDPNKKPYLEEIFNQTKKIVQEIKLQEENPSSEQYNLTEAISRFYNWISELPDNKTDDSDWQDLYDLADILKDYFTLDSEFTILDTISDTMDYLVSLNLTQLESEALIEVIARIESLSNGDSYPFLYNLINNYLIDILKANVPYTKALIGTLTGISAPDTIGDYLIYDARSRYSSNYILNDLQKFLSSNVIQSTVPSDDNLLYGIGTMMDVMAQIKENPRKTTIGGYQFQDHLNINESSSYDILTKILTK
ncbi:MAG: hypothetical protein KatS3mg129_2638 [Leptospiraceae bacterium]|nr:MAG: hypothetical protein KatS3mg129_2638 [Leptospiraceae bacterium]